MRKTMTLRNAILTAACSMVLAAHAVADPKPITIPAGDLIPALETLVKQSGIELVYQADQLKGVKTRGVSGNLSAQDAVTKLLEGTSLTLKTDATGAMSIAPPRVNGDAKKPATTSLQSESAPLRVAQADTAPRSPSDDQPMTRVELDEITVTIPEVLVIGSKSINADIQRTEDDVQPYVVYERSQIERSMSTNLNEFFKTRLPMNTVQDMASQVAGAVRGNQSSINLRGLGDSQTLILVDGRRLPSVSAGGSMDQPDINGIPLAAIERIEVLPATASGIYGGGATGGVINIITRKDYSGVDVQVSYDNTFDTDAGNLRFDGSAGFNFAGGTTSVLIAASHANSNPLLIGDRNFVTRGRALQWANNPTAFLTPTTPPLGYTSNIRSQNGSNLVLDNGTPLNSPRTFVPVGYSGPASDAGAALAVNAGQYNLDLPEGLNGVEQSLLKDPTVSSASINVRRTFDAPVEAFLDLSWYENQSSSFFAGGVPSTTTLAADAPNNPFTTAINVSFPANGLSFLLDSDSEAYRATGGVIVRLPHGWSVGLDYLWSRSRYSYSQANPGVGDPDGAGPALSSATALSSGTLNVMRDVNAFPLDFSPYLLPTPNDIFGPADTTLKDANLRLSGPIVRISGVPLTLSALVEHREEEASDAFQVMNASASVFFTPGRSQTVDAYYLEARAPLVSATSHVPLVRELQLQASVRRDEYKTRAPSPTFAQVPSLDGPLPVLTHSSNEVEATKYTIGLRYSPIQDILIRASLGTGFLPPALNQIVTSTPAAPASRTLTDPKRGGVPSTVPPLTVIAGGNPNLVPEESKSWSVGAIFTPQLLPNLRVSVDYTQIEKTDEIRGLGPQGVVDLEDLLPGRVVRDPLTSSDAALGYTGGVIKEIDNTLVNIAATSLEAYDAQVDYTFKTRRFGDWSFYAIATWQPQFERQIVPSSPFVDTVGFNSGLLEWRGNAGLAWDLGTWTFGWNTQYYDSYFVYAATANDSTRATQALNQGSAVIPQQIYHDAFARFKFNESSDPMGVLSNTEIMFGIQNVFDKEPPILATTGATGGYSTYGDPRLRRYSITVRKSFQ